MFDFTWSVSDCEEFSGGYCFISFPLSNLSIINVSKVFKALYGNEKAYTPPKFKVNDRVRITKKRGIFDKGFTPNWKDEVFIISKIKPTKPTTYIIRDERGEELGGSFYEPELQLSKVDTYRIEKVLRKRVRNGQKQEYVKWYGYDSSHNQWINA